MLTLLVMFVAWEVVDVAQVLSYRVQLLLQHLQIANRIVEAPPQLGFDA